MIKITDKAAKLKGILKVIQMIIMLESKSKGGGCSGLLYDLNFDDIISEKDEFFEDKESKL